MEAINVLIAVKSDALARVIQHVLHGQAGISGIDFADSEQGLVEQAELLRPGLIVVNSRLLGRAASTALTQLRRAAPQSKVILTCDIEEFNRPIDADIADARILDETLVQQLPAIARRLTSRPRTRSSIVRNLALALFAIVFLGTRLQAADTAPSTYSAYTGTDAKTIPTAPALGPANSVINDPTFGSRILRVTDANTQSGESFIPTDAGFHRTWNADSTAIKLTGPHGDGYWEAFNPNTFKVGDGSSQPAIHSVPFGATWEWSTVDPDIIYFLNGNQIAKYNKATSVVTSLGGPSTTDSLGYMAVVIGLDNWVCAAAGSGQQDSFSKIFCINPVSPATSKLIDVYNKTINGVAQGDPNWPTSASGQVIGVHDISGGAGASWLEVTFHQQSWGGDGGAVFNFATNTWSLVTNADNFWSGHVSMGNGKYANASGSADGRDSRGMVVRDPNNLMNSSEYLFVGQPPTTNNGWCDADHSSWLNSVNNPNAPILISRYTIGSSCQFAFTGEIYAAAVDGSNTVYRFAHNHNGGSVCYYAQAFAQISNDGRWALFSSYWDGALGADTSFGCATRIDTFIVELVPSNSSSSTTSSASTGTTTSTPTTATPTTTTPTTATPTTTTPTTTTSTTTAPATTAPATTAPSSSTTWTRTEQSGSAVAYTGTWYPNSGAVNSGSSAVLAADAGSRATFSFTGTSARWIAYRDQWSGIANVYVDGTLVGQVDTYASPDQAQTIAYTTPALTAGNHTLAIEASGQKDSTSGGAWIWVDAFDAGTGGTITTAPATTTPATTAPATTATSATWTRTEQSSSSVAYTGTWYPNSGAFNSGGSAAMAADAGSRATFSFSGTSARWIAYRDQWSGIANVYVDGTLVGQVDAYASPDQAQTIAYTTPALTAGNHTLAIEASGQKNSTSGGAWIWVDAFDVNSGFTSTQAATPVATPATATASALPLILTSQVQTAPPIPSSSVQVGYGIINTGIGAAVLRSFSGQDLVSEADIPASVAANNWTMYAEKGTAVSTGVAIANPNNAAANVNLLLSDGRQTSLLIPAMGQHAAFVDELFGAFQGSFLGTVQIQSNTPVAVLALRGTTNAEGQFIIASIPLDSTAPAIGGTKVFPSVVDGGGYNSELILVNSSSTVSTGSIQFSFNVSTDLGSSGTLNFSIPAGGVWKTRTMGTSGSLTTGYASLVVSGGSPMPDATAMIRLSSNGDLVSETAVPAQSQLSSGLMFGSFEPNIRTGVALVNTQSQDVQVTLTPYDHNGASVAAPTTLTLSAQSQTSKFLDELIAGLPSGFEGSVVLQAPSASPVYATSIRGTTNSNGGFLMSTLSMVDMNQMPSGVHYFPHIVSGGFYKTEFLMMNTGTSAPQLSLFSTGGAPMTMPLQ